MFFSTSKLAALAAAAPMINALPFTGTSSNVAKRGFSASANNNVAAWWGNSPSTNSYDLDKTCSDPSLDIVILTFATSINGNNVAVGGGAEDPSIASTIKKCQSNGKKVFMSIGGATGTIEWTSASQAQAGAKAVAQQFLSSDGMYKTALDGIDLDIETANSAYWSDFTKALRGEMKDGQYISGAPQCPSPDASLPFDVLNQMDFVWVQFYNNGPCNHGASGFDASVKDWSSKLTKPKFYIATPGSQGSAGSGYIGADAIAQEISTVKGFNLDNFGGYAIWDASTGALNSDYQGTIKKALGGSSGSPNPSSGGSSTPVSATATSSASRHVQTHPSTVTSTTTGAATGSVTTVKATSTAHVTKTTYATSASSPTAATSPTGTSATPAPTGGSSAPGTQSCSQASSILCSSDGSKFGICDGTQAVMMPVSDGTVCQNGNIVAVDSGNNSSSSGSSSGTYGGDDQ